MTTPRHLRLLLAIGAVVLVVAVAAVASRSRQAVPGTVTTPPPGATSQPSPSSSPTPAAPTSLELLSSVEVAAQTDPSELLRAGLDLAGGPGGAWLDLAAPRSQPAIERPVYVVEATVSPDRQRVEGRAVIAFHARGEQAILRFLPAAQALRTAGVELEVSVRQAGRAVPSEVDHEGARLLVDLDPTQGSVTSLDISFAYDIAARRDIVDDGGPAAFGLLAWNPNVTALGHWLPLLTLPGEDGPMLPLGDVGGFPVAVFSARIEHDGTLVTGGVEQPCPDPATERTCTWARGTTLRDLAAVVYDGEPDTRVEVAGGVEVRAIAAASSALGNRSALTSATRSISALTDAFGPLAWPQFDVVSVPLSTGAAGMEFPGLVFIDDEIYGSMDGGFGTYVVAHEAGHQWFHAMLGNGSFTSPVVDESLAQYASYLVYLQGYSQAGADGFRERSLEGRYTRARQSGLRDEPPGQTLAEFEGNAAYGPLVYARGALAWLQADDDLGREAVVAFIRGLVERDALDQVTTQDVVDLADVEVPALGAILRRYWLDPDPVR